jgi:nucleoside-triphosphatase THEP1
MSENQYKSHVIKVANRTMGGIGENFIRHQCQRLGFDIDQLTVEQVQKLAIEAKNNSLLIVGHIRAERLRAQIMSILDG